MIKKNTFAEKSVENIGVFAQTAATFCKNLIITLVFEKNDNFFAKNWQKLPKLVILKSTPVTLVCAVPSIALPFSGPFSNHGTKM
jgi:hypothetical protein